MSAKGNNKSICRYLHSKRKANENVGLLKKTCRRLNYLLTPPGNHSRKDLTLVKEDQIKKYLNKTEICKSMGPDGTDAPMLRDLANVIARTLLTVFQRSWGLGKIPRRMQLPLLFPRKARRGIWGCTCQLASPQSLRTDRTNKHRNNFQLHYRQKDMWELSVWLYEGESCPTNLTAFYNGMVGSVVERSAYAVHTDFRHYFP